MKIDTGAAVCNECGWRSSSMPSSLAKELGVVHVIVRHPQVYTLVTGKKPEVSTTQLLELQLYTDPEYPGRRHEW